MLTITKWFVETWTNGTDATRCGLMIISLTYTATVAMVLTFLFAVIGLLLGRGPWDQPPRKRLDPPGAPLHVVKPKRAA
jgi:hypothetical protein